MHREGPDVAARELERAHDESVGGNRDGLSPNRDDRGIIQPVQIGVAEARKKSLSEKLRAELTARAVAELNPAGSSERNRTLESVSGRRHLTASLTASARKRP
jgi:hypothetical protein